jgi:hypothetical protein
MATLEQLRKIATDLKPAGYEVRVADVSPDLGRIHYKKNLILITKDVSNESTLWTLIHEYAHGELGHDSDDFQNAPKHLLEFECEVWTLNKFVEHGLDYEAAFEEAKALLCKRIVKDIMQIQGRTQWEVSGIHEPAYELLTPEQKNEVDKHFSEAIEPMYRDVRFFLQKRSYDGICTPSILSTLIRLRREKKI